VLCPIDQCQEINRAGVWQDQTVNWPAATQGPRQINGGSGIPDVCGGLQPDPNQQPVQCPGADGITASAKEPKSPRPGSANGFSEPSKHRPRPLMAANLIGVALSRSRNGQSPAFSGFFSSLLKSTLAS
jgi:hypothetical protein